MMAFFTSIEREIEQYYINYRSSSRSLTMSTLYAECPDWKLNLLFLSHIVYNIHILY